MSLRTNVLGTVAVVAAFAGAHALRSADGAPAVAHAEPAAVSTVSRDLPVLPTLGPYGRLPALARPRVHHAHPVKKERPTPVTPRREAAREPRATPEPPAAPLPRLRAPQRQPRAPRPDRSYHQPDYEPSPPRAMPVPTPVPRSDPGPPEEVPEDGAPQ
jgi:hypothetical protein